jgi:hypothetical protein
MNNLDSGISEDTKTIIVVLLLIFAYPVGLVFMFLWMKWQTWVKVLVLTPIFLSILAFLMTIGLFIGMWKANDRVETTNTVKTVLVTPTAEQTQIKVRVYPTIRVIKK